MVKKTILRRAGKFVLYILIFVLVVIGAAFIFINTNYGKKIVRNQAQAFLEEKFQSKVSIGAIDYSIPRWIILKEVYLEDQHKDTLLYGRQLSVQLNMLKLITGNIYIRKLELDRIHIFVNRTAKDSVFNYQFVVEAFAGKPTNAPIVKDTTALELTLKQLVLHEVLLNYNDEYDENKFVASIKNLDASITKFQPDRFRFDFDTFYVDGVNFSMVSGKKNAPEILAIDSMVPTTVPVIINAAKVSLKNILVDVQDKFTGMEYSNDLRHISAGNLHFSLQDFKATADQLRLDSSQVKFVAAKPSPVTSPDTAAIPWRVAVKNIIFNNNRFQLDDFSSPAITGFDPAHLSARQISLDADGLYYSADSTALLVKQLTFKDTSGLELDTTHARILYTNHQISATELYLKTPGSLLQNSLQVQFDGLAQLAANPQRSFVQAKFLNTTIAVNDLYIISLLTKKLLPPEKFSNNSIRLNTELRGSLQQLYIPYLQMSGLGGTVINAKAILYNITDTKNFSYDITIFNSTIPKADMVKFISGENRQLIESLPTGINIGARLTGSRKRILTQIDLKSSTLLFSGKVALENIDVPGRLKYDLTIDKSRVERDFILAMVGENVLPASIQLPDVVIATGRLKGDMNNLVTQVKLGGSFGNASLKGYLRNFKNPETATYDLQLAATDFALGKLIKQDTLLGNITVSAIAKGKGFNYRTMQSRITGDIAALELNNYSYQNIKLQTDLNSGNIGSNGSISDSSLRMQYTATSNVSGKYPTIEATISIDTIQLKNLHLYEDTLNLSLSAYVKADNLEPRNLDLYALIDSGRVFMHNKNYLLDSIEALGKTVDGINNIRFKSPFADATATGAFDYDKIGSSLVQYINHYYVITDTVIQQTDTAVQQIEFTGEIKKHPLLIDLVPGLVGYENITFKGNYASQMGDSALQLSINSPHIEYQTNILTNARLDIHAANEQLIYTAGFDNFQSGSNMLYSSSLRGTIYNDTISLIAVINDRKNVNRYIFGGTLLAKENDFSFALSDSLLLNYKKWKVATNNHIGYTPAGILVNNFVLSNDSSSISAASQLGIPNNPIDIAIKNFDIRDITSALNRDTLTASGFIDARIVVGEFNKKLPAFTGTAEIRNLAVMQQPVGNLLLSTQKVDENTIHATLGLSENGNRVIADGNYYLNNDQQQFDASMYIKSLQMATLQGFSMGYMSRSSGSLNGDLEIRGRFMQPEWKGKINFDTTRFTLTQFGTTYAIDRQKILFDYPAITFNQFTITDSLANPLIIDGNLQAKTLTQYDLNLQLTSRDFTLINAPKAINNQVYGYAGLGVNVSVTGSTTYPVIEGNVSLNNKTDVTMVMPESNVDKDAAKSVVRFIDRDTFALPEMESFKPAVEPKANITQFLNYNLNIQVDKEAALTIVIDPSTGDELKVKGDAQLNAGVEPGGNIIVAGTYLLHSGYYILNYQFLKKRFNLLQGSTIHFSGDPTGAEINITAEYIANSSPKDLVGNEVGSVDPKIANSFNQKIPFRVILYLKGTLKKPEISFDLQLPEKGAISSELRATIENKLVQIRNDKAAVNKQVFALLVFGRFVGEQSVDFFKGNSSGGGFADIARESVSEFLSAALDQIASDLFTGINIDLNLNTYKDFITSDGTQKTDLNVEVSKNFINDRLSISIGKNFGIEGQDASAKAAQQKGSRFLPDVTVNYKLSKDGKYMIRAYNKDQFEVILDGYVIETGLSFIVTLDYDKFNELFIKERKKEGQ